MLNPIFWPSVNYALRHLLRPVAGLLHPDLHPRVTGVITVDLDADRSIQLACNPTSYMAKVLFFQGVTGYEYDTVRLFRGLAARSSVFLDVGANIGYYALLAAAYNPSLDVLAFEPLPGAFRFLRRNVQLNGFDQIQTRNEALADEPGTATFSFAVDPTFADLDDHLTSTGSLAGDAANGSSGAFTRTFDVRTETLDHVAAAHLDDATVDLIKLDVEGAEARVLQGGQRVLSDHRPFVISEVLPDRVEASVEDLFQAHDYRFFRIGDEAVQEVDRLAPTDTHHRNYLMAPSERVPALQDLSDAPPISVLAS
jgi:FkbM family methyltransferase